MFYGDNLREVIEPPLLEEGPLEAFGTQTFQAHETVARPESTRQASREEGGRPYPNLVDNMQAPAAKAGRGRSRERPVPNPEPSRRPHRGGAEGYQRKEGAHLKPGVKKRQRDMTPAEMRRKGSWAVRFYGRKGKLPPLTTKDGKPTRFALTAAAWGEPVPKTVAAARRIAAKGRRLLEAYRASRAS